MSEIQDTQCKICTVLLIQNDCETLKKIILNIHDPIFCMEIIPYLALFCRSFQEYCNMDLINKDVDSEIYDIRNSIKIYGERYGKSKKEFLESDRKQDDEFRDGLRFDFAKNLNIHFNLGIYFDENKRIVGNTQLIANTLNMHGLTKRERQEKSFNLGCHLASIIGSVSNGLADSLPVPNIILKENIPVFYYDDFNTNRNAFFNPIFSKDINLLMLHILSSINFVKYVLTPLLVEENVWIFRINYIVIYHAYLGLKKMKMHIENNYTDAIEMISRLNSILEYGETLFLSKFRNCMMHYDLKNNGVFVITEDNFDEKKLLYGLIEECFNGEIYKSYFEKIIDMGEQIENFITQQFNFDIVSLKNF